jgi:hypothetical protein
MKREEHAKINHNHAIERRFLWNIMTQSAQCAHLSCHNVGSAPLRSKNPLARVIDFDRS